MLTYGGHAFPADHFDLGDGEHGMTLRDYFAAKAMAAFIAEPVDGIQQAVFRGFGSGTAKLLAEASYVMADAMLAERDKR